ncbi:MAG TPA: Uma2 family endonuclease [Ktedonobacterales bacterium]|nr:Uma2 family endonuclease [Ktedonobacterales bacterium]
MALPQPFQPILTTPEEYLELDRHSPVRHEYVDGYAYALAGGSLNHSAICGKLWFLLYSRLQGTSCRVYTSDARVRLSATRFVYPDLTITCEPHDQGTTDLLQSPRVVIEALSPSTQEYDRGDKFAYYRACPTLQEYVLVATERRSIEVYRRPQTQEEDQPWALQMYAPGDEIALSSLTIQIPLDEVYSDTTVA